MNPKLKYPLVVLFETISVIIFSLPRFRTANALKSNFLKLMGSKIGRRVVYYPGVWIVTGKNLRLGDDVDLAKGVLITTDGGVSIGDRTLVGYGTSIISRNHNLPPAPGRIFSSGHSSSKVDIGADVWIGANCTILPGVTIGEGAVVGAGSVVTRDVAKFSVVAGVPAQFIRPRD